MLISIYASAVCFPGGLLDSYECEQRVWMHAWEEVNFSLHHHIRSQTVVLYPRHSEGKFLIFPNRNLQLSPCQVGCEMRESILDGDLGQIL